MTSAPKIRIAIVASATRPRLARLILERKDIYILHPERTVRSVRTPLMQNHWRREEKGVQGTSPAGVQGVSPCLSLFPQEVGWLYTNQCDMLFEFATLSFCYTILYMLRE